MERLKRTVTCGGIRVNHVGHRVVLNGWVHRQRDHGGVLFFDIRDRYGLSQIVVDADSAPELQEIAAELKFEYCVAVAGIVRHRPDGMVNTAMPTGHVEVQALDIEILSRCDSLPFVIDERVDAREELRMRYRYLDLRSASMQRKLKLRHDVAFAIREYLVEQGFYEIETPTLIRSTPEGARDFLVPSRVFPGKFYALPQSPQLFKQILMVSGFDKYFQIARCFRDEDARGDRQIEHTQIDIEMSFVSKEKIFGIVEGFLAHVFEKVLGKTLATPFERLTYAEAMGRYGSDKPDIRYGLELADFNAYAAQGGFRVFQTVVAGGGSVRCLVVPGGGEFPRSKIDELEKTAKIHGAQGLAWMKVTDGGIEGGIAKFYQPSASTILAALKASAGDLLLFVGADLKTACTALGAVRSTLAAQLDLIPTDEFRFCWVTDFPLFEWDSEENRWAASHHMFTMPQPEYIPTLEESPASVKGELYDLVCNGVELASGSIRIHDIELQKRIFKIVGISDEEAQDRFGFLLDAFKYGPPPHGGIAPGLDRLVMLMAGETSIREVIAFPKTTQGASLMDDTPAGIDSSQLKELHLQVLWDQETPD